MTEGVVTTLVVPAALPPTQVATTTQEVTLQTIDLQETKTRSLCRGQKTGSAKRSPSWSGMLGSHWREGSQGLDFGDLCSRKLPVRRCGISLHLLGSGR